MDITVLNPGLLTTIQDIGRYGYQKHGVIVSGAMDTYAMRLANIIVGNDENEAILEITLIGPSLSISKGNLISITGADLSPTINNKKVPMGRGVYIIEDCVLEFGECISGCRCYLAVAGGFDIPVFMGSKSTCLRVRLGGKDGSALHKNDVLNIGNKSEICFNIINKLSESYKEERFVFTSWYIRNFKMQNSDHTVIRVFEDRQFKDVSEESINKFLNCFFFIDTKSDRMGYRLNGPKMTFKKNIEMISGEVSFGTIQIPPDGNPIILLSDRATAGGYPKIAHVASYDIPRLVQRKPSDKIKFKMITLKEAEELYLKREKYIGQIKESIKRLSDYHTCF